MSLNTVGDLMTEVLVRNNRTTVDSFITDVMLQDWTRMAHKWAASQHKWPFSEGRTTTTFTSGAGSNGDEWFLEGYKSDTFRLMQIGGKRLTKLSLAQYQQLLEDQPEAEDRVFSDYGRTVFINPNIDLSGTLTAWGQYEPTLDPTDLAATTIFSGFDEEGNEAVVEKMNSYLKKRDGLMQEAEQSDQKARAILDEMWNRILDEQYAYQTSPTSDGMFERFDVIQGGLTDEIFKRDQFT